MSSPPQTAAPPPPMPGVTPTTPSPAAPAPTQGTTTYIPVPIPAQVGKSGNFGAAVVALALLLLAAFLLRTLWRLPEALAHKQWVHTLGGQYAAQNKLLHVIGYLALASGFFTGNVLMGLTTAAALMIAANTRVQGGAQDTPAQ